MATLESFHAQLVARRAKIESDVFVHPPKDWPEFQHRLGEHIAVNTLINDIAAEIQGREDDDQ